MPISLRCTRESEAPVIDQGELTHNLDERFVELSRRICSFSATSHALLTLGFVETMKASWIRKIREIVFRETDSRLDNKKAVMRRITYRQESLPA